MIPGQGTKISHATPCSQKNNDNKTYIMYIQYTYSLYIFYYSNNIIKYYFNCLILYSHNIDTMTADTFKTAFLQPHYPQEKKKKRKDSSSFLAPDRKKSQKRALIGLNWIMCSALNQLLRPGVINTMTGLSWVDLCGQRDRICCHKGWGSGQGV